MVAVTDACRKLAGRADGAAPLQVDRTRELRRIGELLFVGDVDAFKHELVVLGVQPSKMPSDSETIGQQPLVLGLDATHRAFAGIGEVAEEAARRVCGEHRELDVFVVVVEGREVQEQALVEQRHLGTDFEAVHHFVVEG